MRSFSSYPLQSCPSFVRRGTLRVLTVTTIRATRFPVERDKLSDRNLALEKRDSPLALETRSLMPARSVQNRRGLSRYLSQSLTSDYHVFEEDEVKQLSTFIKSYLVEVHGYGDASDLPLWKRVFPQLQRTSDPSLLMAMDRANIPYFIDVSDKRFTVVHTIGRTKDTDQTLRLLADGTTQGFDRAWLPSQFLFDSRVGTLRGFKFSHEPVALGVTLTREREQPQSSPVALANEYDSLEMQSPPESVSIVTTGRIPARGQRSSMWVRDSYTALNDYNGIRESKVFANRQALDSIQYRAITDKGRSIDHGLYSNGKIVANGTSIGLHMLAVENLKSSYASIIRWLENDCATGWNGGTLGRSLSGEPLIIRFSADTVIEDLQLFARSIFRASRPFRLFGFPHRVSDRRIDVEAIDLHTGDEFSVEMTRDWMRLYLPKGTCGNVVARLYTNLLHSLDSDTSLTSGSGEVVFASKAAG
jgi:hypothetical protein